MYMQHLQVCAMHHLQVCAMHNIDDNVSHCGIFLLRLEMTQSAAWACKCNCILHADCLKTVLVESFDNSHTKVCAQLHFHAGPSNLQLAAAQPTLFLLLL